MGQQTIISVPDWAISAVQAYSDTAWNLSQSVNAIPSVFISSGQGAVASAALSGGAVVGATVLYGGQFYSTPPIITFVPSDLLLTGSGATGYALINNGVITDIIVTDPGSDYVSNPNVVITLQGSGAMGAAVIGEGQIISVTVVKGGNGYTVPPTVVIVGGRGSGAEITAVLTGGSVTSFIVNNPGMGYSIIDTSFEPYPGITTAPQDANETDGINNLASRGAGGNPTISAAYALADSLIKGENLSGLPTSFWNKVSAQEAVAFASVFALIGKKAFYINDPDAPLAQVLTMGTKSLYFARLKARLENENYHDERVSMDTALGLGIDLAQQAALDAETLRKAGLYMRDYTQGTYELAYKLYIEQEEFNVFKLEVFGNCLRAVTGSQQTTTSTDRTASSVMNAVGIVSAATGVYSALSSAGVVPGISSLFASAAAASEATEAVTALNAVEGLFVAASIPIEI